MKLYGIWDFNEKNWIREFDRYDAILAFTNQRAARARAVENWGFDTYRDLKQSSYGEVRLLVEGK